LIVIEHNMDIIKNSDYIIDMGYEGGDKGGQVIAEGSVEELINNMKKTKSYTAKFLKKEIEND